jgi:hypothetical protein
MVLRDGTDPPDGSDFQEPGEGVGVVVESLVSKSLDSASMSGR